MNPKTIIVVAAYALVLGSLALLVNSYLNRGKQIEQLETVVGQYKEANGKWVEHDKQIQQQLSAASEEIKRLQELYSKNTTTITRTRTIIREAAKKVDPADLQKLEEYQALVNDTLQRQQQCLNATLKGSSDVSTC